MSARTFPYAESAVAAEIGLPRPEMRALRDRLLLKKEWSEDSSGAVVLSRRALEKIAAELGLEDCEKMATRLGPASNGAAVPVDALVKLKVTLIPPNDALVLASDAAGVRHTVHVGRNENFVMGMELSARPYLGHAGIWKLEGPMPRVRGRW